VIALFENVIYIISMKGLFTELDPLIIFIDIKYMFCSEHSYSLLYVCISLNDNIAS